jgi:SAM-dependent MidA family methyltransferase
MIKESGPLSFSSFMELALYHEEFGYYTDPTRTRVGQTGDFATSVSVGATYGRLLALRIHQVWEAHGNPQVFPVLEPGPEDGSLALDILRAAREQDPAFHQALHYTACEPGTRKREALADRFADTGETNLRVVAAATEAKAEWGIILANEVLDALPVHLVRWSGRSWQEIFVGLESEKLAWNMAPCSDSPLSDHLAKLPTDLPEGYTTEVCMGLFPFMKELAATFEDTLLLLVDYGFERSEYYHPDRCEGTLQTYTRHQVGKDPLEAPGERDLSTHLDLTSVGEAAQAAGLTSLGSARQESYLVHLASEFLQNLSSPGADREFLSQFQTLTHPAFFGSRFHFLEFAKGPISSGLVFPGRF